MGAALVHQTLHGYSDGHRLIAGSLTLSSADARTMQVMSDLSGPGVRPAPSGYLTGYPLEGSGRYILARTWAAPEMPRPGCVWTHSLVIENADLATMTSAAGMLALFRRPNGSAPRDGYTSPLELRHLADPALPTTPLMVARSAEVLNALYAAPEKAVVVQTGDDDDQLATAIWMQQWPRLRRVFGFCTLTKVDRSLKGEALDLQMVPSGERQLRAKFNEAVNPADVEFEPVISTLAADLFEPGVTKLREFLRRTGGDVEGGRTAMVPLLMLYNAVFVGAPDLSPAVTAFGMLDSLGRRQARSLRLIVAKQAVEQVDNIDEEVFDFLVDALQQDFDSTDETDLGPRFGTALWRRSPSKFVEALSEGGPVGRAVEEAMAMIDAGELVAGVGEDARAAERIARRRPELLEKPAFWQIPGVDESMVETIDNDAAAQVAHALMSSGKFAQVPNLISRADPAHLAAALEFDKPGGDAARLWMNSLSRNPDKAAAVLASGRLRRTKTLVAISRAMAPDDVPNDFGEDPWSIALRLAQGKLSTTDEDYLCAFLMSRALGRRSRSAAHLLQRAYTTVHKTLLRGGLPFDEEWLVTARLEWGNWLTWDKVSRLRTTVVNRFVSERLDPETFGRLSDDGGIMKELIDEAARTALGRRYLEDVRKELKHAPEKHIRTRADYIAKQT